MNHTMTGGLKIFGPFEYSIYYFYDYLYAENSIVYLRFKAEKGDLQRRAVKTVHFHPKGGTFLPFYQDTYNEIYEEDELCSHEEAVTLVKAYYEQLRLDNLERL